MRIGKWLLCFVGFFAAVAQAGVSEKKIVLPDNLGTASLYQSERSSGPVVVVVHEWWGLNDYARKRAKMLAEAGYSAIAVDMYGTGKSTSHPKDATAFMNAALAEPEKMNARFEAAVAAVKKASSQTSPKVYAIGYCFGGAVVLNQARRGLELAGVASFHGSLGTENKAEPGVVKAKVLVATGGADPMVPAEQVGNFVAEMSAAGVDLQLLSFPQAKHSFTNPGSTAIGKKHGLPLAYNAEADQQSWSALLRMLGGE
ncbi:dienelactone hydrolase family protein [Spongiibacter sp. KMU-166]|uniref:Dienelactone hydrolase family protein n=1 Tax=Spongiibacter thalassae TaxID=2721624 RepID=A0ABX1GFZ7_9GAMM|nr:alpha/beta fold hydrolase [Spongiibacter thalassae]NKI18066.1 dienelactone hydrolase family protein [Spongiibacter thalassae]